MVFCDIISTLYKGDEKMKQTLKEEKNEFLNRKIEPQENFVMVRKFYEATGAFDSIFFATCEEGCTIRRNKENYLDYHLSFLGKEYDYTLFGSRKRKEEPQIFYRNLGRKFSEKYLNLLPFFEEGQIMVTAYVHSSRENERVLNSWLEETIDGQAYVLDINHNLIMKREDYFEVFFPEIITVHTYEEKPILEEMIRSFGIKPEVAVVFQNELQEEIKEKQLKIGS